jgi:hypothetical protein
MFIQIERISSQSKRGCTHDCNVSSCSTAATWFLVDRDMPQSNEASLGERTCCAAHITSTYMSLRGAHVVAQSARAVAVGDVRASRRRSLNRRPVPGVLGRIEVSQPG